MQLEMRTFYNSLYQNPSRSVSTFRLSMVRLSTPVASMGKPATVQYRNIFYRRLRQQTDRFIRSDIPRFTTTHQSFTPDHAGTYNRYISAVFLPDKTIVKKTMTIIPGVINSWFRFIVAPASLSAGAWQQPQPPVLIYNEILL